MYSYRCFPFPQDIPRNIRPQFLAGNSRISFNTWAVFGWDTTLRITPETHGLSSYTKGIRHFGRATVFFDCLRDWSHTSKSTSVELQSQQN